MSQLTRPQAVILRNAILADPVVSLQVGVADQPILDWLNALTTFRVWRTITPVSDIQDNIVWANFTPANPAAGAGTDATNWLLACQGKQFNLQNLLSSGSGFSGGVSTNKPNIRAGLQDACTLIPSGVAGATKTGGWTQIQLAIQRAATKAEQLLATGTGTQANPGDLGFDGNIQNSDLYIILNRDGQG
jgi:hypothetical protein